MKAGGSPRASGRATISAGLQAMEHPAMPAGPVHHRGKCKSQDPTYRFGSIERERRISGQGANIFCEVDSRSEP
jgi:hypothetical protein